VTEDKSRSLKCACFVWIKKNVYIAQEENNETELKILNTDIGGWKKNI